MSNRTKRRAEQRRNANINRQSETAAAKPATSEAQIAANRENSSHSTGPTSSAGKAAVSQNRRVHGLNYNPATFRVLACENQSEYDQLVQILRDEQSPTDTVENLLVVSMAQHRWLLDRATRLQETCFDQATGQVTDQKLFALYMRYATTHERAFHKCLNDLVKLRSLKQKTEIGFESEKRKADHHQWDLLFRDMEYTVQQMKHPEAGNEQRRANLAQEQEKAARKAA